MIRESLYVAVDVGTTKVTTLVGVAHPDGQVEVVGAGVVPSAGVAKGAVVSIPEAQEAIQASLEEAARSSGQPIRQAYATVTGTHLEFTTRVGTIRSPHYSLPITHGEVDKAIEVAHPDGGDTDRQVLHMVPRSFAVDGLKGVRNPIGMHAQRLDVEALCVTASSAPIRNLVRAIEHSRVRVAGLIMAGLAAGESVLTRDEREIGVLLVEIGGGVTTVAAFQQDALAIADILPVGGCNCTNDLSMALSTPFETAEEMKLEYGDLMPDPTKSDPVAVQPFGDGPSSKVERREICRYLRDRTEEILRLAYLKARSLGYGAIPPAGVVITGGVAGTPGIQTLARRLYSSPVRIGVPRSLPGMDEGLTDPSFASSLGALMWCARNSTLRVQKPLRLAVKLPFHLGGGNGHAEEASGQLNGNGHHANGNTSKGAEVQAKAVAWLKERARRVAL